MQISQIEQLLDTAVALVVAGTGSTSKPITSSELRIGNNFPMAFREAVNYLVPIIGSITDLSIFDDRRILCLNGSEIFSFQRLASLLIQRALDVGVNRTAVDLQRYIENDSFVVRKAILLGGVSLNEEVSLANDIKLSPFQWHDPANSSIIPRHPFFDDIGSNPSLNKVTALLSKQYTHPKLHEPPTSAHRVTLHEAMWFEDLEEALLCLTLAGPSGPAIVGTSVHVVDWNPSVGGPFGQAPSPVEIRRVTMLTSDMLREFQAVYRKFFQLPSSTKERFKIPLHRLNLSMRRAWGVDAAIDIGIALEVLFSDNKPFDSSIGFNLRLRAARLLADTQNDRIALAKTISDLYELRSQAAHSGTLPARVRGISSEELLAKGSSVAAEAVKHMIIHGIPDWNALIFGP